MLKFVIFLPLLATAVNSLTCVFPFTYKGHEHKKCTDMNANYLWCSPTYEYNGISVPCDEDELRQKMLRDNYSKMLERIAEHTDKLEELEKKGDSGKTEKCANCEQEVGEIKNTMPGLNAVASDHERRIAAASEEIEKQIRRATRLVAASEYIQKRALRVTRRRVQRTWYGTAPFCKGSCPGGFRHIENSSSGDGKKCWTGHKSLCERVYYV